jgi:hypothetical protein
VEPIPPIPLVTETPSRSGSTSGEPASAHASRAATIANCSQRSIRRAWTRPTICAGSSAATPAMRAGRSFTQSSVSALTPLFPASMPDQVDATSPPRGVVAPSPVTTTLLSSVPTVIGSSILVPPGPVVGPGRVIPLR